jgi:hypothetical protein
MTIRQLDSLPSMNRRLQFVETDDAYLSEDLDEDDDEPQRDDDVTSQIARTRLVSDSPAAGDSPSFTTRRGTRVVSDWVHLRDQLERSGGERRDRRGGWEAAVIRGTSKGISFAGGIAEIPAPPNVDVPRGPRCKSV